MKLLISPIDRDEALEAVRGGADIIDVKNPAEGSLGANFPWIISEIKGLLPNGIELSATIGDFPNLPGTASLAALGVASLGVNYVKIGLYGVNSSQDAIKLATPTVRAVKDSYPDTKVVIAGYADYERVGSIPSTLIPSVAKDAGADIAMLDTAVKDGKNLFSFLNLDELKEFTQRAHNSGIRVALGGSLTKEHIQPLSEIGVDIIGIRGAACRNSDRIGGRIKAELVKELRDCIKNSN